MTELRGVVNLLASWLRRRSVMVWCFFWLLLWKSIRDWGKQERNRGTVTLLIVAIPVIGLIAGLHQVDKQARERSDHRFEQLLRAQEKANHDGLLIIYNTAVVQCKKGFQSGTQRRAAALAINRFSSLLQSQFTIALQRAEVTEKDPRSTDAARAGAESAIRFYRSTIGVLPHLYVNPPPRPCSETVRNPLDLAHGTLPPSG